MSFHSLPLRQEEIHRFVGLLAAVVSWCLAAHEIRAQELAPFVSHAGGAVVLPVPPETSVSELAVGRSLRLILSSAAAPSSIAELRDGLWVDVRHRGAGHQRPATATELVQLLTERPGVQALGAPRPVTHDRFSGVRQEFRTVDDLRGFHEVVELPHATVRIGVVGPAEHWPEREAHWNALIAAARLTDPQLPETRPPAPLADAAPLIGTWKSLAGKIEWAASGRVGLRADGARSYQLDADGRLDYENELQTLAGSYAAHDDLIEITWDDGSRLNYRWKIVQGDLYLTDHHGRVSVLWRLLK